jgi:hypothetical protein
MSAEQLSPAKIAEALGASPAKVKKAIESLGLQPSSKKGVCSFYDAASVAKIKAALK